MAEAGAAVASRGAWGVCESPLIKNDISNNITVDLSAYPLKINVDASLNNIINTKQNIFTCISPLIKHDISGAWGVGQEWGVGGAAVPLGLGGTAPFGAGRQGRCGAH